jgi:BNR/Asp-box repeat protein
MRRALVAIAVLVLAGCGGDDPAASGRSDRLVDFSKKPPYVNSLERDDKTDELLLTTNRGFYRIDPGTDRVRRQPASITADGKRASLGTFLELDLAEDGSLVGSGHPDPGSQLPQYLGYLRSTDGGKTWSVISRLGLADLHKIVFKHDRLYAWDAVLSAMLISEDGGKNFTEHFTPRGLIIDFEVDPEDPERIVASTDEQLYRSLDGGDSWRPALREEGVRLSWPTEDKLYIATKDGRVQVSEDGGDTYDDVGRVDGEPYVLKTEGEDELLMALSDGSVLRTTDGGETWEDVFRP